jgi:hypothetical protein
VAWQHQYHRVESRHQNRSGRGPRPRRELCCWNEASQRPPLYERVLMQAGNKEREEVVVVCCLGADKTVQSCDAGI